MAMTASVKDELSRLSVSKPCCRKAEVSAILRFAGGLHISAGKIMVEIELDTAQAARRIRKDIADVYGHDSDLAVISAGGLRKGSRYLVRVIKDGDALARQTGLVDSHGRPVRGLPPQVVSAGICDAESAWRGAFLAHGSLTEPGRSSALEITCPGPEAALALVGAARRLGITAKAREVRGVDRVVIRDGDAIGVLLTRLGAHESVMAWEERRMRREVRATADSQILMMRILDVLHVQLSQHRRAYNAPWKFLATIFLIIFAKRDNFVSLMAKQVWKSSALSHLHL